MRSSSVTYFFKYYVLDQQLTIFNYTTNLTVTSFTSNFLLLGNIAGLLGAIYAKSFARTVDKKNAYSGALIVSSIISCCFYFVQPHNVMLIFSFSLIGGFPFRGCLSTPMGHIHRYCRLWGMEIRKKIDRSHYGGISIRAEAWSCIWPVHVWHGLWHITDMSIMLSRLNILFTGFECS